MEVLQINRFALLHDGEDIFFSNTDQVLETFKEIEKIDHDVILLSGNGDTQVGFYEGEGDVYGKTNAMITQMPKNIKHWFAQNNITKKENIIPLPIGIQNSFSILGSPGYDWIDPTVLPRVFEDDDTKPTRSFYLNYCNRPGHRKKVTEMCEQYLGITYHEHTLKYDRYLADILDHEAVICPAGMAVDTYRLYEVLYCKRIPITVKVGKYGVAYSNEDEVSWTGTSCCPPLKEEYPMYTELYTQLPVVMLDDIEELKDADHLMKLVEEQKKKDWDRNLLDFAYWKNMILTLKEQL